MDTLGYTIRFIFYYMERFYFISITFTLIIR